jgi:hypothetical protein
MNPESRKSALLDNGSLTHVSIEMRIREDRLDTKGSFHFNPINKGLHGYALATNVSNGHTLDSTSGSAEESESGTQCLGVYSDHSVPGGYKYGDLALQVGGISHLRELHSMPNIHLQMIVLT